MDSGQEIRAIHDEVENPSTPAKKVEKTFSAKWLSRAYNLCRFWNWFAVGVFITQAVIILSPKIVDVMIPGASVIYTSAGVLSGALVGGEKIVEKLKGKSDGN